MPSDGRIERLAEHLDVPSEELRFWRAPGRVNLVGEHIDYLGGRVLPFACDLEVLCAATPRPGEVVLSSLEEPGRATVPLDGPAAADGWAAYVAGVVGALREAGLRMEGVRGALTSTIPVGAGLSSSAALEAVVALAVTGGVRPPAEVLREAEHRATGVPCGLMDQVAVLHGRAGHALLLDCSTGGREQVPLPGSIGFVVVDTGTRRRLADGRYAERQREASRALASLGRDAGLDGLTPADVETLPDPGRRRLRHAVGEHRRVDEAAEALRVGDAEGLGGLLEASHASLRDDFEVSSEALDTAAEAIRGVNGCLGARLVGAGFAGCVLGVVRAGAEGAVATEAADRLRGRLPGCRAFGVHAVDGAGPAEVLRA